MAKPWGRYEIGFMRHPKFLALSGNALALWWEGKNYCDEHHTDGLIPMAALKGFRFRGQKTVALLTTSCGQKADGTHYAPLWETHPIGIKMHDYLDYNLCRDEHLAADEARKKDRLRLKAWREAKKQEGETPSVAVRETRFKRIPETPLEEKRIEEKRKESTPVSEGTPMEVPTESAATRGVAPPMAPLFLEFPTDGNPSSWALTDTQVTAWQWSYGSLDVAAECRKALAWVQASPTHRKTAGGMPRFLVNWLNRATNRPHGGVRDGGSVAARSGRTGAPPPGKYDGIEES